MIPCTAPLSFAQSARLCVVAFVLATPLSVVAATPADAPAAANAQKPAFPILEFRVEGNSTLPIETVERAVYPFLGESRSIDDVESARAELEKRYHAAGFGTVGVDIPPQKVKDGIVTLRVVEGSVGEVHVVGARYYSQGRILDAVPALAQGTVPNLDQVQAEVAQLNNGTDRRVTPLLRAGKTPGTTDVDLEVQDDLPLHGSLEVDNHYTPLTSHARMTASLDYDNLFQLEQRISLLAQTAPEDPNQVKVWSASYTIPAAGQYLAFSFVRSDSDTVAGIGSTEIFGRGKIIGAHDIIPLAAQRLGPDETFTQSVTAGVDYKDFDENVTIGPRTGFATPITYAPLTLAYAASLIQPRGAQWDFGISLELALRDYFGSNDAQFDDKRYKALTNFAILKWSVDRTQPLPEGFSLYGRLETQLADQPLVSNEALVLGGADSVRGYLDASVSGDSGARTTFELRSPNLLSASSYGLTDLRTHFFIDAGYARVLFPLPEQTASFELVSTGVGLRLKAGPQASLEMDLGFPMRRVLYTVPWSPRLQAEATLGF